MSPFSYLIDISMKKLNLLSDIVQNYRSLVLKLRRIAFEFVWFIGSGWQVG